MRAVRKTNAETESPLLDNRQLRDKCVGRFEVLDRVKVLLLIPEMETMTVQQVADYYEVSQEAIKLVTMRHSDELESDGAKIEKMENFLKLQDVTFQKERNKAILTYPNGMTFTVTNRGLRVFPRRAILRIGMLLRDSEIAKEIRTQLLNIEEKVSDDVKVADVNEEQKLMLEVGMAVASGDANAVAIASTNLIAFKNRHIKQLENDNKGLAGQILEWSDRKRLNAGIRQLAAVTGIPFGNMWNELYKNLQYKYGICLKQRGGTPYLQWIKESEWESVIKTFCAMCEAYEQSPTEMFQQITPTKALAKAN